MKANLKQFTSFMSNYGSGCGSGALHPSACSKFSSLGIELRVLETEQVYIKDRSGSRFGWRLVRRLEPMSRSRAVLRSKLRSRSRALLRLVLKSESRFRSRAVLRSVLRSRWKSRSRVLLRLVLRSGSRSIQVLRSRLTH